MLVDIIIQSILISFLFFSLLLIPCGDAYGNVVGQFDGSKLVFLRRSCFCFSSFRFEQGHRTTNYFELNSYSREKSDEHMFNSSSIQEKIYIIPICSKIEISLF